MIIVQFVPLVKLVSGIRYADIAFYHISTMESGATKHDIPLLQNKTVICNTEAECFQ